MTTRRGFLAGMLAIGAVPGIVTSKGVLAPFEPRLVVVPAFQDIAISLGDYLDRWPEGGEMLRLPLSEEAARVKREVLRQLAERPMVIGVDRGIPGGDQTAIALRQGPRVVTFRRRIP